MPAFKRIGNPGILSLVFTGGAAIAVVEGSENTCQPDKQKSLQEGAREVPCVTQAPCFVKA